MNRKLCLNLLVLLIISLVALSDGNCQFTSKPGIPNPTITFLNDSVVRLDYDSIYQVHEFWDTIQYPSAIGNINNTQVGKYDYGRIFNDLMTVLDAREYHFVPIYGDDDLRYGKIPGWIHGGAPNIRGAKNIGFDNNAYDKSPEHPEWGEIYRMPHMNDIKFLDRPQNGPLGPLPNYGSTLFLFHEIGHTWGVFWNTSVANPLGWTPLNWQPWMPPITLVAGGSHWWTVGSNRWVNPINTGILTSAPSINRFNIFDLYAMGALPYSNIVDSVLYVRDPNTLKEYPVTVDSLILALSKAQYYLDNTRPEDVPDYLEGREYMEGNGRRIPATDPNTQNFKTLIVLVTGKESVFTRSDQNLILKLAKDVPPDWEIATRGYSHMNTKLEHKMVNDLTITTPASRNSVNITWQNFVSGYNPYKQNNPDGIRIESLPSSGTLTFNGLPVSVGQYFDLLDFGQFTYTKAAGKKFVSVEFKWNAITNGRWAVPATVKIVPTSSQLTTTVPSVKTEAGITVTGNEGTVVSIFPNPFGKTISVSVTNSASTSFKIELHDMNGRARYQKIIRTKDNGKNTIIIDDIPDEITGMLNLSITLEGTTLRRTILRNLKSER